MKLKGNIMKNEFDIRGSFPLPAIPLSLFPFSFLCVLRVLYILLDFNP